MIGVILATHNGADTIEQTLQALCDISQPQGGWQLIVVNNASTDETSHIIHRFSSHLPLRYVEEPNLGKLLTKLTGPEAAAPAVNSAALIK